MRLTLSIVYVFVGALVFALPNMTRRELLFAVPVPPDFRESPAGRHAIRMFRLIVAAAVAAGACALLLAPAGLANAMAGAMPIAISLAGVLAFWRQNRALAAAAQQYTRPREAEMNLGSACFAPVARSRAKMTNPGDGELPTSHIQQRNAAFENAGRKSSILSASL